MLSSRTFFFQDRPALMKPFWIMGMILVLVFFIDFLVVLILNRQSRSVRIQAGLLAVNVIIQLYCNWVVYCYYLKVSS